MMIWAVYLKCWIGKMFKQLLFTFLFICCAFAAMAQQTDSLKKPAADTVPVKKDTVIRTTFAPKIKKEKIYHPDSTHSPRLARIRSTIIPGWGQVYNRKWWKVPLIYTGLGLLGVAVVYNQTYYNQFLALGQIKRQYLNVKPTEGQPLYDKFKKYETEYNLYANLSSEVMYNAADGYRRNRELSILGGIVVWGLNIVDAYIDAKFINSFTVDNDLSMKVTPGFIGQPMYAADFNSAYIPGIKITFTLR
jgi:hypothetical protein